MTYLTYILLGIVIYVSIISIFIWANKNPKFKFDKVTKEDIHFDMAGDLMYAITILAFVTFFVIVLWPLLFIGLLVFGIGYRIYSCLPSRNKE
jgi:nitrogen fixation-related uncharacterized protein